MASERAPELQKDGPLGEKEIKLVGTKTLEEKVESLRPLQFKLINLMNSNLRYEVIYKNLLRDLRKYFFQDFNECSDFSRNKKKASPNYYFSCIKEYIKQKKIYEFSSKDQEISEEELENLAFHLGSLISPKDMLKNSQSLAKRNSNEMREEEVEK